MFLFTKRLSPICFLLLFSSCTLLGQEKMKEKIIYVWDPLCGWCYGFEPQIEKFQQNFKKQYDFEVLVGGMVLPPNGNTMGQMREFLTGAIPQLEKTTGITIAQAYYNNILSNDDLKLYSITPCLVFNYLKSDYQGKETTLARTIQDLLYKQGYNTNELETYRSLIEETDHNFDDASLQIQSQKNIDANSMIQGVIDSDVFVVMLTNSYMSRWYCLLEFATALFYKKPIIVIVEENPMFWQWDFKRWQANICSRESEHKNAEERGWKSSMNFDEQQGKMISSLQNTFKDLETKDMGFGNFPELQGSPNNAKHNILFFFLCYFRYGLNMTLRIRLCPALIFTHMEPDPFEFKFHDLYILKFQTQHTNSPTKGG